MSDGPNEKLSNEEARALRALGRDVAPTPELEGRIVSELKRRGRIRARGGFIMQTARIVGVAAVLAVVFVAGLATGKRGAVPPEHSAPVTEPAAAAANQYMLLMFTRSDGTHEQTAEPVSEAAREAYQKIVYEYRDWARARQTEGRLVGADKLADAARVMTRANGETHVAASLADPRVLGGYFTITARDLDEAVEIARSHPHLKYGGEVEVRPIEVVE